MITFLASDRCDKCGAQAYVETQHFNGRLLWCAHHAREHWSAISHLVTRDAREKVAS